MTDHESLVHDFYANHLLDGDASSASRYFSETFVDHDPPSPSLPRGREGVVGVMRYLAAAFSERSIRVHDVFGRDDKVAIRFTIEGTHSGPFRGLAPTGKRVTLHIIAILRLEAGKIAERWGKAEVIGL